jgi:hypothetical protein
LSWDEYSVLESCTPDDGKSLHDQYWRRGNKK